MKREHITNALLTMMISLISGLGLWVWHMETRMVLVEDHQITDEDEREVAKDLIKDWPGYKKQIDQNTGEISSLFDHWENSTEEAEEKELIGFQRLQAVETKVEIYHPNNRKQ